MKEIDFVIKPAGKGFEVGFMQGSKTLFVGNFVHKHEATEWFEKMNQEYAYFAKKFWPTSQATVAASFYHKFISNNLYKENMSFSKAISMKFFFGIVLSSL
mgnify:CR=1 FL=1